MSSILDPISTELMLVDKRVGNAYQVVKLVCAYLDQIRFVADNMPVLTEVYGNLKTLRRVDGLTGFAGETVSIAMPVDIAVSKVVASTVVILGENDVMYGFESGAFTAYMDGTQLKLTLAINAPDEITKSAIRWMITYEK